MYIKFSIKYCIKIEQGGCSNVLGKMFDLLGGIFKLF